MASAGAKPTRVRKSPELRREEILDAASRQIGQLGFRGFTVRGLALASGLSHAGMLHHFTSKEELLGALVDRLEQRQIAAIDPYIAQCEAELAAGTATLADIRALLATMMRLGTSDIGLTRLVAVLQAEALDPAHPAHASFRRREYDSLEFLERLVTRFVPSPKVAARGIHAAMTGLTQQWLSEEQNFNLEATWQAVVAQMLPDPA